MSKMPKADGELSVLNVGDGDTKLSFDPKNPAERIRAARIVGDMLKRGYALLVARDDGKGGTEYVRAEAFDPQTCEYIIADFDPVAAAEHDAKEQQEQQDGQQGQASAPAAPGAAAKAPASPRGRTRRVDASKARAVGVAPISGG